MPTFTYKGNQYTAHHIAVKLRNVDAARAILERVNEVVKTCGEGLQVAAWRSALTSFPELSMYITPNGDYNVATIQQRVDQAERAYVKDHAEVENPPAFDRTAAYEEAKEWCQQRVQQLVMGTPELARLITFTSGAYPTTLEALTQGVQIIKDSVDRERTDAVVLELIDQPIEGEFWQDVDASEVAAYINSFRAQFK